MENIYEIEEGLLFSELTEKQRKLIKVLDHEELIMAGNMINNDQGGVLPIHDIEDYLSECMELDTIPMDDFHPLALVVIEYNEAILMN